MIVDLLTRPVPDLTADEEQQVKRVAEEVLAVLKREKLVLDWRKEQRTRAAVRVTVEETLDWPRWHAPDLCPEVRRRLPARLRVVLRRRTQRLRAGCIAPSRATWPAGKGPEPCGNPDTAPALRRASGVASIGSARFQLGAVGGVNAARTAAGARSARCLGHFGLVRHTPRCRCDWPFHPAAPVDDESRTAMNNAYAEGAKSSATPSSGMQARIHACTEEETWRSTRSRTRKAVSGRRRSRSAWPPRSRARTCRRC